MLWWHYQLIPVHAIFSDWWLPSNQSSGIYLRATIPSGNSGCASSKIVFSFSVSSTLSLHFNIGFYLTHWFIHSCCLYALDRLLARLLVHHPCLPRKLITNLIQFRTTLILLISILYQYKRRRCGDFTYPASPWLAPVSPILKIVPSVRRLYYPSAHKNKHRI